MAYWASSPWLSTSPAKQDMTRPSGHFVPFSPLPPASMSRATSPSCMSAPFQLAGTKTRFTSSFGQTKREKYHTEVAASRSGRRCGKMVCMVPPDRGFRTQVSRSFPASLWAKLPGIDLAEDKKAVSAGGVEDDEVHAVFLEDPDLGGLNLERSHHRALNFGGGDPFQDTEKIMLLPIDSVELISRKVISEADVQIIVEEHPHGRGLLLEVADPRLILKDLLHRSPLPQFLRIELSGHFIRMVKLPFLPLTHP